MISKLDPPMRRSAGVNDQNPWPGLKAFEEGDCEYFYGRDQETAELFRLVNRETLTVLFGQSGLGKTSLLQAGLFPKLREADFLPLYLHLRHSDKALPLVDQVRGKITEAIDLENVEAFRPGENETLWEYFHRRDVEFWSLKNRLLTPVLVFDQFEEIFTLGRENETLRARCAAFVTELADLIEKRPPAALKKKWEAGQDDVNVTRFEFERESFKVVLSLREDYLAHLEGLRPLIRSLMHNRFRILHMNGQQAFSVVTGPGADIVDEGVAVQIVQLVAGSRAPASAISPAETQMLQLEIDPALLSLVCHQLNQRRLSLGQPKISSDLLKGSHREILETFYNESLSGLPPEVRVFIEDRLLTRLGGYRNSIALEDALAERGITPEIITRLVTGRLLRHETHLGVLCIEVAHDVLTGVILASRRAREQKAAEDALVAQRAETERAIWEAEKKLAKERDRTAREKLKTRWALAATALAAIFGVVGWGLFAEATRATQKAEKARKDADEVIYFMGTDLTPRLEPIRQLELLSAVNEKVLDYYDKLKDVDETDAVRIGKSIALAQRGRICDEKGKVGDALEAHAASLRIARGLFERAPGDAGFASIFEVECENVAMAKWRRGDLQGAVVLLGEGFKAAKQAVLEEDSRPTQIADLANRRARFADAIKAQGKFSEAFALYGESLEERKNLATRKEATKGDKDGLFSSYIDLGDALMASGDLSRALEYFQDSLAIAKELKEAKPSDCDRLHELSQSYDRVGAALQASGKLSEAGDVFVESNSLFEKLVDQDPNNAGWQRNYSVTLQRLLDVLETRGNFPDAGKWFAILLKIRSGLAEIDESDADAQDDLAEAYALEGRHFLAHGDLKGALADCKKALELYSKTAAKDATNLDRQEYLADAHDKLGDVLRAQGAFEPALAERNKSLEIRQKQAQLDPGNTIRRNNLATSLEHLGDAFKDQSDTASAHQTYERALAIRQALAVKDATNAQWKDGLGVVCRKLGQISAAEQKFTEAFERLQTSHGILNELVKLDPTNAYWKADLAEAEIANAEADQEQGDNEHAGQRLRTALKVREELATLDATNTERQAEYAHALYLTATTINRNEPKAKAEAEQMLTKARDLMQKLEDRAELTHEQQQWLAEINQ